MILQLPATASGNDVSEFVTSSGRGDTEHAQAPVTPACMQGRWTDTGKAHWEQ